MVQKITMDDLLADGSKSASIKQGDILEGKIVRATKSTAWVDMGQFGVGMVPRREMGYGALTPEQEVSVYVVDPEIDPGVALLSIKRANKDKGWTDVEDLLTNGEVVEVIPFDANRGGLLVEFKGLRGFLPVSQLASENYPRVGAEKDEILTKLKSLVGKKMSVKIIDGDKKANKIIFSEKEARNDDIKDRIANLKVGDEIECKITGVVDFGAFVNADGLEGLIHISEIAWERVTDPNKHLKEGDIVKAKIIGLDKERLSLSIKQLSDDPWSEEVDKFKKGDKAEGEITRITPFGAFVQLSPVVEGLVHISEIDSESSSPEEIFKVGEAKKFTILDVDKPNRKISLSLK
jgi:small subunit ribosomal protein S1